MFGVSVVEVLPAADATGFRGRLSGHGEMSQTGGQVQGPGGCHAEMPERAGCLTPGYYLRQTQWDKSDGSPGCDAGQVKLSYGMNYVHHIHMLKL